LHDKARLAAGINSGLVVTTLLGLAWLVSGLNCGCRQPER
jgi:hypothetical protein